MRTLLRPALVLAVLAPFSAAQCLVAEHGTADDPFFHAGFMALDGDQMICVDGGFDTYFMERTPGGWVERERYFLGVLTSNLMYPAVDIRGDIAVATDPNGVPSRAVVYQRVAGRWRIHSVLIPDGNTSPGFGASVAIADSGDILIGYQGFFTGDAVYVFEGDAASGWTEGPVLVSSSGPGGDTGFGLRAASDGNIAVVTALHENAVHVFEHGPSGWTEVQVLADPGGEQNFFGAGLDLDGSRLLIGAPLGGPGEDGLAYFYERGAAGWSLVRQFSGPGGPLSSFFGQHVALRGDLAVASSAEFQNDRGMAQTFQFIGGEWRWGERIDPPLPDTFQRFGQALALDDERLFVGAPNLDVPGGHGALYEFGLRVPELPWFCPPNANSTGAPARLTQAGCPRLSVQAWELIADSLPPGTRTDLVLATPSARLPFLDGVLCLGRPYFRLPSTLSDPTGVARVPMDFTVEPGASLLAGVAYGLQVVYRDPAGGPSGANLSNALVVEFLP